MHKPALFLSLLLVMGSSPQAQSHKPELTLFKAAEIVTMDKTNSHFANAAVAVVDGTILAIDTESSLRSNFGKTHQITVNDDFKDKVLLPGFVEPHLHTWLSGLLMSTEFVTPDDWNLPWAQVKGVTTPAAFLARIQALDNQLPEGKPLIVWGYHQHFHGHDMGRDWLNKVADSRPVIIWHRSFHELFFNDAALTLFGWQAEDWQGTQAYHQQLDWPRGHAYENGLKLVMEPVMQYLLESGDFLVGMQRTKAYVAAGGITTAVDPGVVTTPEMFDVMRDALLDDGLFMDYWLIPAGNLSFQLANQNPMRGKLIAESFANTFQAQGQIRWLPKFIKLFADGAMYSQLMQLKDGYQDGHHGEWMQTPEDLEASLRPYWQDGYTAFIHVNGDKGFYKTMEIIEKLNEEMPRTDHRTSFHHLGITDPNDITRAVNAGINFSVNPYYTHILGELYADHGIGAERAHEMARAASFLKSGGVLSLHSDAPMSPASPLTLVWAAVNRIGLSGVDVLGEKEKITVQQALKAMTIDAAYSVRLENQVGSLEPGKQANFAVLERNPLKTEPKQIKDIKVIATVYKGQSKFH